MFHGTYRMPTERTIDLDQVLLEANVGLGNQLHKGRPPL